MLSKLAHNLLQSKHKLCKSVLKSGSQSLTYLASYNYLKNQKQDYEKNNYFMSQMKNSLIKENEFDFKFKQEKNIIIAFVKRKHFPGNSAENKNERQQQKLPESNRKRDNKKLQENLIALHSSDYNSNQVYKINCLMFIAYMLKMNIKIEQGYHIHHFYQSSFLENDQYKSIVRTLMDLTENDLSDLIQYSIQCLLQEQILKMQANQKLDIVINIIQVGLQQKFALFIKQIILSIPDSEFKLIKPWRAVYTIKEFPKLLQHLSFRDMDYINEQISDILKEKIQNIGSYFILDMAESINKLSQHSPKSHIPFKSFTVALQKRVLELINEEESKQTNESQDNLVKKPKFILQMIQVIKHHQEDLNLELVEKLETNLAQVVPYNNPFKAHLLFFNSIAVLNFGEKLLQNICNNIKDKSSEYYQEAFNYNIKFQIKLMYNEQLLYIQKQTQNLWSKQYLYQQDIQDIELFKETELFQSFNEIISQKLNTVEDLNSLDIQTQLLMRRLYGILYKSNEKLCQLVETNVQQNQKLFLKSDTNASSNEFNSDLMMYMNQKEIEYEVEKFIGYRNCDIFIPSLNLIIELDGKYHLQEAKLAKDQFRNICYLKQGYKMLEINIKNWEIFRLEGKIDQILDQKLNEFKENPNLVLSHI
ncbi:hypothetical protein TTHERM_00937710 (macronuclear) [Tetrahymena thermophila SB210]|uniref:RAP domain protein n=1 Tax=Tetrahymena thermophila (strain SB210) TaxID=312017 RepID=Q23UG1_TETTS|nr:hypothetical protein TTHERM_00937710 [Tetrahymena thermophila SB210]EAS00197.2 hypothetical protein TTHERM_00937710 [Tetrahymena thermophila SB210]|eukprot:XP_001020442.2 hypothetical protein TTHERM_00937710 [Tetrahymena thermophila SB210]